MSTILIGVDSTARSEDAVALARRLARPGTAEIVVATVASPEHPDREEAHLVVRRMSGLLTGIEPERIRTAVVAAPSPAHGLHRLAESESCALVVVGSTHTGHLGRVRPGSTGERLLSGSPCAVAVAPHGYRTRRDVSVKRITSAWDGSPESQAALAAAIGAARAFGADLEIATVLITAGTTAVMDAASYATLRQDTQDALRRDLDEAVLGASTLVGTTGTLLDGLPWRELATRSEHADLLFAGSRAYGPLHAVITGGTSGPLMRHAHCPVIVLPRGADTPMVNLFDGDVTTAAG